MNKVYIAVGSNLGNREHYLHQALERLQGRAGIRLLQKSSVYETEPVGGPPQGKYLNAVWKIETSLRPKPLLELLLSVERGLGRKRGESNAPRTIDLDLLAYGDEIVEEDGLTIPHPRLAEREFVLRPLAEISPAWRHPGLHKTACQLLEQWLEHPSKS
ncbi:MAG: 2-amino-4-hydroxy-6-hydroxymethyldihydropteridine diphosphokinase [Candidatus Omnitrophica bacterium]|nr:2-amino-4-hydroxy-6-hydroxymethyldihydropteridine diphosphokinase [Candidatus Omnitrophota bacterium]